MCSRGSILGSIAGIGLAYATGGLSLAAEGAASIGGFTLGSIATAASLGSAVGGMLDAPKPVAPQSVGGAPNPVADQTAAQDQARVAATQRRRALGAGSPRSLLATAGGALGDTSQAAIGSATAAPVTKQALGA